MPKPNREERRRLARLNQPRTQGAEQKPTKESATPTRVVSSLLDAMQDGNEYQSILDAVPPPGTNLIDDILRAIADLERIRGRPCLMYAGNVVKKDESGASSIDSSDDLPFREMVGKVPINERSVDIFLATGGGSAQQVNNFVNCLRDRFDEVDFLIPSFCMSAGTLFALSGNHIFMTDRACLGPIDPQVPTAAGRYVPAQALLSLVAEIQRAGDDALKSGAGVPWAFVRILDTLDKKELGEALTASRYSETMAAQFLQKHKFRDWTITETSRKPVSDADRATRAAEIASALGSHDRWKSHGHAISRGVLWDEIRLRIDHPVPDLNRAMIRLWALITYVFDKTPIVKVMCSAQYRYLRHVTVEVITAGRKP